MIKRDIDTWYEIRDPNIVFKWSPLISVHDDDCTESELDFYHAEETQCDRFNMRVLEACTLLCKAADLCMYETRRIVDNDEIPF